MVHRVSLRGSCELPFLLGDKMKVDEFDFMNEVGRRYSLEEKDTQAFWHIQYWMWQAGIRDGRIHDDTIKIMHRFGDLGV